MFDIPLTVMKTTKVVDKKTGQVSEIEEEVPNRWPTFERAAHNLGVCFDTFTEWRKTHPEFSAAYKKCKQLQREHLMQNCLANRFQNTFGIFVAKAVCGMREDQGEQDYHSVEFTEE